MKIECPNIMFCNFTAETISYCQKLMAGAKAQAVALAPLLKKVNEESFWASHYVPLYKKMKNYHIQTMKFYMFSSIYRRYKSGNRQAILMKFCRNVSQVTRNPSDIVTAPN